MRCALRSALVTLLLCVPAAMASAETCSPEQFRKEVDAAGAALRKLNAENTPKIDAAMRRLREKLAWSEEEANQKATVLLSDAKSEAYDGAAAALLLKLDRLAEAAGSGTPDCEKLGELRSTAAELQATVRVKTQYMLSKIDRLVGGGSAPAQAARHPEPQKKHEPPKKSVAVAKPPAPPKAKVEPQPAPPPPTSWSTSTSGQAPVAPPPARPAPMPMPQVREHAQAFSKDEIREASRGFFGTVSSGLATVIEHAFSVLGRPSAYVLGNEGGGAFFAGIRYGKGKLFTRTGAVREVYWHGPSIGYDFGASGSKTMFLVYNLKQELDIFSGFSGVDGSAYLVGGVGMTVLTDGNVVMAPIRSGVGLRFGASIGYVRFTARPTWNPF
ncbi:MAG: DUF1134 domain-containing protein [Hyphomicrobiaceae bacterium]